MGFLKILQMSAVHNLLQTNTINWLNAVHIGFMGLFQHNKFLVFKMVLDFVITFGMICNKTRLPSGMENSFPPVLRALCSVVFVYSPMCTDLQPTSTYDIPVPKSSWILTHWNHSCSSSTNYHIVCGPHVQT